MAYINHPFSQFGGLIVQNMVTSDPYSAWNVDFSRLRHETELLETGLGNCVTYLHALRKKYARNERLLNLDPLPPRKKRKKIQQSQRELARDIKNRERDEQAFLNNLRACKANMYIAGGLPYATTDMSSTGADYASSTTQCSAGDSEPAGISWKGWTEDANVSPFTKHHVHAEFTKEIAPDECHETLGNDVVVRAPPLQPSGTADVVLSPRAALKPDATVFEPTVPPTRGVSHAERRIDKLNDLSWLDTKASAAKSVRTSKVVEICESMQDLSITTNPDSQRKGSQTWCDTSPQQTPRSPTVRRTRTNSL
jgi:hypothetical protein